MYFAQTLPKPDKLVKVNVHGRHVQTLIQQCGCCPRFYAENYQKHTRMNLGRDRPFPYKWHNGASNLYFAKIEMKENRFNSYRSPKAILNVLFESVNVVEFYRALGEATLTPRSKKWLTLYDGVCEPVISGKARFYMLVSANLKSFYIGSTYILAASDVKIVCFGYFDADVTVDIRERERVEYKICELLG